MKNRRFLVIVALALVISAILIIMNQSHKTDKLAVIKIGAILPMTGNLAFMGEMEKNALLLAEADCNEQKLLGDYQIKIIIGDSKGDAKEAAALAQRFYTVDKVDVLWTSLTGVSYSVEPIATANKILQIAFCMDPDISKKSEYLFRLYEGMMEEGQALIKYLSKDNSKKKIGIIYIKIAATEKVVNDLLIPELKNQGKDIVFVDSYEFSSRDFRSLLMKLKTANPDYFIIYDYGFLLPFIFDSLNMLGLLGKTQIIGGWGFLYSLISHNLDTNLLDGTLVVGPSFILDKNDKAKNFIDRFEKIYKKPPNFDAGFAYDSIMILIEAINRAGEFQVNKVIKFLNNIYNYEGVMGKLSVIDRELQVEMVIGIIKSGNVIAVEN